jgi:hypothetical protein
VSHEIDPVEAALADALRRAAEAGAFGVVEVLARELEARRRAREAEQPPGVIRLDERRGGKG